MYIWFYYVTNGKKNSASTIELWLHLRELLMSKKLESHLAIASYISYTSFSFLHFFQLAYQTPLYAHNSIVQAELFTILLHTCMH